MVKKRAIYSRKFHWTAKIIFAIQNYVLAICAFLLGYKVTSSFDHSAPVIDGMWAIISGVMVWDTTPKKTIRLSKYRIMASFIGAYIAGFYLFFFGFSTLGIGICIFLGVLFNYLIDFERGIKPTGVTIAVVLLISSIKPDINPLLNATLRLTESALGCGIAVLVSYFPIPPRYRFVNGK